MSQISNYYTLRVPSVPSPDRTEWHGDLIGPFSVLTHGNFKTIGEAIAWAREKLNGCPYQIMLVTENGWIDALAPMKLFKVTLWFSALDARRYRINHRAKVVVSALDERDACNRGWEAISTQYEKHEPMLWPDGRLAPSAEEAGDVVIVESSLGVL